MKKMHRDAKIKDERWFRVWEPEGSRMKNSLGRDVNAGLKPLAQCMEALRADEQVGFNRLPRTEAGFQSADSKVENGLGRKVNETVFVFSRPNFCLKSDKYYFTGVRTMTGITRVVLRR